MDMDLVCMNQELKQYTTKCIFCNLVKSCIYYQYNDKPQLKGKPICEVCFYDEGLET